MAKTNGLRFLEVLEYAKVGNKICRPTWKAGKFVFWVPDGVAVLTIARELLMEHRGCVCVSDGAEMPYVAHIRGIDILADDWLVVE